MDDSVQNGLMRRDVYLASSSVVQLLATLVRQQSFYSLLRCARTLSHTYTRISITIVTPSRWRRKTWRCCSCVRRSSCSRFKRAVVGWVHRRPRPSRWYLPFACHWRCRHYRTESSLSNTNDCTHNSSIPTRSEPMSVFSIVFSNVFHRLDLHLSLLTSMVMERMVHYNQSNRSIDRDRAI